MRGAIRMIISKQMYRFYLREDERALNIERNIRSYLFNDIWHFQRQLRLLEYRKNCKVSIIGKLMAAWSQIKVRRLGRKLGFSIPANVFGPGLSIAHAGTIVVNGNARVGANCRIHVCVNIGADAGDGDRAPIIGDGCYIAPGAKIFGDIHIGDNVGIGANAVVNKSFPSNVTVAGVPAGIISNQGPKEFRPHEKMAS